MTSPARLTELRLTEFKSFQDQVLPLGGLTVLIGRNAAGKSNALDALQALSRLADGLSLRDALDGTSHAVSPIRGGSKGCTPAGRNQFSLGATAMADGAWYKTDITVQIGSRLALTLDRIEWPDGALPHFGSRTQSPGFAALGRPGVQFEPADSPLAIQIRQASAALSSALGDVFMLDPDPKVMRAYSSSEDARLLPDGSNISAAAFKLRDDDPEAFHRLEDLVGAVTGKRVTGLGFVETEIGDVQMLLHERVGTEIVDMPARLASDGTLRILAFATAILTTPRREEHEGPERLIVIEEVERGLYPAQARTLLELMERELTSRAASVLITTHSPTLLEALTPKHHTDVIVCSRDSESGRSRLDRLTDLPGYAELIAAGGLGEAVTGDGLDRAHDERPKNAREFFDFLESM